ncbi:MAG TPA: bifunctional alpha,alpha-trehalose-phosphate synthase (UDP-forming)/trehalose-phosphatase [candidate division WOR-3 bacterium]|uniref:Alpha,alpha-trehalose-phosphate synthase n=1 Tax=candidate division WOR-3 bacterium TaxID=2052148 RepID=A0A9C9K0T4_UNCW3|nr:bifunctional alpha,alpha-trehalose-phosphate synthase (UDP-forming)/trehalose-phosphatase [candidate division WOR-3 bacterium]
MSKLLIVSNRLPVTVAKRGGSLKLQSSVGGLATGLDSFHKVYKSLWIGWPGYVSSKFEEEKKIIEKKLSVKKCYPVFLSPYDVENYYYGFCNKIIWPLFHYFTQHVVYEKKFWNAYLRVNKQFCRMVSRIAKPKDKIWIHDYQLMLLPQMLREKLPDATIGFFLHIPFPSSEVFRLLPCRTEIIEGILGADLIGFHTHDYVHHFTESVRRLLGYEYVLGHINACHRKVKVDAFPMGIDYMKYHNASYSSAVQKEITRIRKKLGDRKIIVSIDRLDYTKGIPERLEAFDLFLERNPSYRKRVTLILVAVPSRTNVEHYVLLKKQVDELISRINGKYGDIGWVPIWYLYRFLPFEKLVSLYNIADVALVTPLRDGMNLIAKEFIASKTNGHGVLILGEMAGAAKELGEAIIVNPNNKEEIVEAIEKALVMPENEQIRRNKVMQKRLQRYNVERWAHDFMDRMQHIKKLQKELCMSKLNWKLTTQLINDYIKSKSRLILLDYDGTLTSFTENPSDAYPSKEVKKLLAALAKENRNNVVIVSGRRRETLNEWFPTESLGLIGEHGVWIKDKNSTWQLIEPLGNEWKKQIKPILEIYVDRTPGSFIEEKDYSLVWHYRKADPKLALIRSGELKDAITNLTGNLNLGILEGSKILEIKNTGINKGRAVMYWLNKRKWDFIMAIGDDWTDEDIFAVLPPHAYSIKVGLGFSKARYNVDNPAEVIKLLKRLANL